MEAMSFLDIIQKYDGLIALAFSGFMILLASKFITREHFSSERALIVGRLDINSSKVEALEDRMTIMEKDIEHLPSRDATHRLELAVLRLEGKMETMDERLKPVAEMARRTQEHLLNDK